ncbi:MAG: hypothetical protein EA360_02205 [Balneolaceae bacterium]|nr:MAG: hypothetical protein EA360_02205 [Balneolaceae bacterium]
MCNQIHSFFLFIFISVVLGLTGCSDDPTGTDLDIGDVSITITGDIEKNVSGGQADFDGMQTGQIHSWEISLNDLNPQTYSLVFLKIDTEQFAQPGTGAYSLGEVNGGFDAFFDNIVGNFDITEYSTFSLCETGEAGGTLTLEASSASVVRGSFDFTAVKEDFDENFDCQVLGSIRVRGEFRALPRRSI